MRNKNNRGLASHISDDEILRNESSPNLAVKDTKRHGHLCAGFTLIELLMVVTIIGILAAIAVPKFVGLGKKASIKASIAEIRVIGSALERYEMDNQMFPSTEQGLKALIEKPSTSPVPRDWNGPYLSEDINDPWDNPYQYRNPPQSGRTDYDLWSKGPDGTDGTADDVTNWKKEK
ncbi:MAG: type II secretion system major pseudopilin GspG [Planctomycetota bacterium]